MDLGSCSVKSGKKIGKKDIIWGGGGSDIWEKFPNIPVFADFFPDLTDQDPKSNYLKVIKLIRCHLPPIVKHVLVPQNDFGMPKINWSNHKSFWNEETPPPMLGKIPK